MEFKKYPHLERFTNTEVAGLLKGTCHVFPKIDGSNASIWYDGSKLCTGSRQRDLSVEGAEDNAGFNAYVQENSEKYLPLFLMLPTARLYGEWLVKHTLPYREDAYRKFYVFDVTLQSAVNPEVETFLPYEEYQPVLEQLGIEYVPLLTTVTDYEGNWSEILPLNRFLLDEAGKPEGIVVKRYDFINQYGRVTWGKIVQEHFHEQKGTKKFNPANSVEEDIVNRWLLPSVVQKERAKLEVAGVDKIQPRLLEAVWWDFLSETLPTVIHKNSKLVLNFSAVRNAVYSFTKKVAEDLF